MEAYIAKYRATKSFVVFSDTLSRITACVLFIIVLLIPNCSNLNLCWTCLSVNCYCLLFCFFSIVRTLNSLSCLLRIPFFSSVLHVLFSTASRTAIFWTFSVALRNVFWDDVSVHDLIITAFVCLIILFKLPIPVYDS